MWVIEHAFVCVCVCAYVCVCVHFKLIVSRSKEKTNIKQTLKEDAENQQSNCPLTKWSKKITDKCVQVEVSGSASHDTLHNTTLYS